MKHIKPYKIFENSQETDHSYNREKIERLCNKLYKNYTINDDLSINVYGDVHLRGYGFESLPLKYKYVSGNFYCHYNKLTSLKGSAKEVGGDFICSNNDLTSLKGAPNSVGGGFICSDNKLMSVKYLPNGIDYHIHVTDFSNNPIYSVINTFIYKDNAEDLIQEFNEYDILRGDKVVLSRLKAFISDFDLEMPNIDEVKKYYKVV